MHTEIPAFSFICAALVLIPLPWHIRARNIAALSIGAWLFIANIIYVVDALIWSNNADPRVPVWCDISSSVIVGSHIALPATCLCICIHLERVASFCQTSTPVAKRRRILFESVMCFGLPIVYMALHLIVQPRRFDVYEGFGCRPTTYASIPTIFLMWIPPLFLSAAAVFCAGIAWRHFLYQGVQFSTGGTVSPSPSSLTSGSYIRLIVMAVLEAFWSIIILAIVMRFSLSSGLAPWTNFADVHKDFSVVFMYSANVTPAKTTSFLVFSWVAVLIQSIVFFLAFASREETLAGIAGCTNWVLHRFRKKDNSILPAIPVHSPDMMSGPTAPITVLDFATTSGKSASGSDCYDPFAKSPLSSPEPSRPPSLDLSHQKQLDADHVFMNDTLESPTARSAIASSHNSLESNFDPQQIIISPVYWPEPPSKVPVRTPRRSTSMGYLQSLRDGQRSPFDDSAIQLSSSPRRKPIRRSQSRNAIYMTVVRETHSEV